MLTIVMACAFSVLIFSGPLASYVSTGIAIILSGAFVLGVVTALTSSYAGTIARPHEIPVTIIALMAPSIAAHMADARVGSIFASVIVSIMIASLATGSFFLVLGYLDLGNLIRFVPYPVIGGFLAGTGLLLVKGAIGVMTGKNLAFADLMNLLVDLIVKLVPGLVFALVLFLVLRWRNHYLIMPVWLLVSFVLFYAIAYMAGKSVTELNVGGWLIGSVDLHTSGPLSLTYFSEINWKIVAMQTGRFITILILSCISLLLNASGLEIVVGEDIDLNRELRSTGFANLLSGFTGSTVGFHSLSLSALGYSMGVKSRMVGIICAALCGLIAIAGSSILSYFPRAIMGGILLFLGLTFLFEWLCQTWSRLPFSDYILIVFILVIIGMFGFLQGVAIGMFVAIVIFVVKYSHISVVKHMLSGASFHSNVDRAPGQLEVLSERGDSVCILKLQGYIFFGTANDLYDKIRTRVNDRNQQKIRFVVLDFGLVNGVDSSAVNTFKKMKDQARSGGYNLIFSQVGGGDIASLSRGGFDTGDSDYFRILSDLDLAVEWCEDKIFEEDGIFPEHEGYPLEDHLRDLFPDDVKKIGTFMEYVEQKEVPAGFYLIWQNDPPHSLYYLESGRATVNIEDDRGQPVRLRTISPGTVIGELGLYLREPSTASVVTQSQSVFYKITADSLERMEKEDPVIAAGFHRFIIKRIGEKLIYTNLALKAHLD